MNVIRIRNEVGIREYKSTKIWGVHSIVRPRSWCAIEWTSFTAAQKILLGRSSY